MTETTIAAKARAMHAADPSLTVRQIADALFTDETRVRVALAAEDRATYTARVSVGRRSKRKGRAA